MSNNDFSLKVLPRQHKDQCENLSEKSGENLCINQSSSFVAFEKICRICLKNGEIPIYGGEDAEDISEDIKSCADIDMNVNDVFPKHLCEICHSLLTSAILLRKLAKESAELLYKEHQRLEEAVKPITAGIDNNNDHDDLYEMELSKSFECSYCKLHFSTVEEYKTHKSSKQHRNAQIECPTCQRVLTARMYKRHLARHDSASLICDVCGKMFRKDNLMRHLQLHTYELPYQCEVCPYRGRYVDSLKIHMRIHTGNKPFSCDKCQLRFLTRSNLNRHILTHKKDRPFKCNECNRGFYTKKDLDTHFKADHAGIKEFCCKACGTKFGRRKSLRRHELKVHNRDKLGKGRFPLYLQAEYRKDCES